MPEVTLPLDWKPRDYQMPLWSALESGCRRTATVWHRRAGKDSVSLNWTVCQAHQRVGMYWHVLPTYKQGRKIIWEGMTKEGRPFLSFWPKETEANRRNDEMTWWLKNGSMWQVIGAETKEDVDKLVGANPVGVVFSEYSLMVPEIWDFVRPILLENGGWAMFIYTPRGRNHGYKLHRMAQRNDRWFSELLTVDDTGTITEQQIQEERDDGMPEELVQQEFYCSFDAPLVGAYYGDLMTQMLNEERMTRVPWEPAKKVETWWDLGISDATAIWFMQPIGREMRAIDYHEHSGVGLEHYAKILAERPYVYSEHLVPHDAMVRELGTGKSRFEMARSLGLRFRVVPKLSLEDGINAVRSMLPKVYADEVKCERGLQAMREYTKERVLGETDPDGRPIFRDKPKHDWTSHAADAFRTGAVGHRAQRAKPEKLAPDLAIV